METNGGYEVKVCNLCGGAGTIEDNGKFIECKCSFYRRIANSMPGYVRTSPVKEAHSTHKCLSLTGKNVYLISNWSDTKSLIKCIMIKDHNKFIKITSDRELRDVYVGAHSKKSKSNDDDISVVYNSLEEFLEGPDLVFVRLNELKHKNIAAPGTLDEAVSYRIDRNKPTWLISDPTDPFCSHSHAYSNDLWSKIQSLFVFMTVEQINKIETIETINTEAGIVTPQLQQKRPKVQVQEQEDVSQEAEPTFGGINSIYGSGSKQKSQFNRRK